jgi:hypothetical protein
VLSNLGLPQTHLKLEKSKVGDSIRQYLLRKRIYFKNKWKKQLKPLSDKMYSESDWFRLENSINKFLNEAKEYIIQPSVSLAYIMGKVLAKEENKGETIDNKDIAIVMDDSVNTILNQYTGKNVNKIKDLDEVEKRILSVSIQNTGRYIKNLSNDITTKIQQTVNNAIINREGEKQLSNNLFNEMVGVNRDMRRVAAYELVSAHNQGHIIATTEMNKEVGIDKTYMMLNNLKGACDFCQDWNKEVVIVLDEPPKTGDKVNDKYAKYAIWPGKNNVGRDKKEWWIAMTAQHPHCNCFWTPYNPE